MIPWCRIAAPEPWLVGGWTNPLWKIWYRQNGFIFQNFRGEHEKYLSCNHPVGVGNKKRFGYQVYLGMISFPGCANRHHQDCFRVFVNLYETSFVIVTGCQVDANSKIIPNESPKRITTATVLYNLMISFKLIHLHDCHDCFIGGEVSHGYEYPVEHTTLCTATNDNILNPWLKSLRHSFFWDLGILQTILNKRNARCLCVLHPKKVQPTKLQLSPTTRWDNTSYM